MGNAQPVVLLHDDNTLVIDNCGFRKLLIEINKSKGTVTTYDQGGCCGIGRKAAPERGVEVPQHCFPISEIIGIGTHLIAERSQGGQQHQNHGHGHTQVSSHTSWIYCYDTKIFRSNGKVYKSAIFFYPTLI